MKIILSYFFAVILLFSCGHKVKKAGVTDSIVSVVAKPNIIKGQNDTLVIPQDTIAKVILPEGTIQVAEYPADTSSKVKILDNGSYSKQDNVGPEDAKLDWKGLFYNKDHYYVKSTQIKFIRQRSQFDENPNERTGWLLKCVDKDTVLQLISGIDNLISGPVKRIKLDEFYYAGQKQEFVYEGVLYTLYSTGAKRNGYVYNFKLFLTAKVKGRMFNQQLVSLGNDVALHHGNDAIDNIFLDFAGDIDGDKIPDFLISDAGYAFGSTSLYLSKSAGESAILKLVAYFGQSD